MESTDKKTKAVRIIIFSAVVIGIVILMRFVVAGSSTSGKYDSFAQCLVTKGATFYGAFWCPHCQAQERALDATREKLASEGLYKECSTPDGKGQTQTCIDKGVESYPTWIFADGSKKTSEQTLADLSAATGCQLPTGASSETSMTGGASSAAQ